MKLWRIVKSRFLKQKNEQWIQDRRDKCKNCEWNTLNKTNITIKQKFLKNLLDAYSQISGNEDEDTLGNCTACEMCSVFYKSSEKLEKCPKNKWNG